MPSIEDDLAKWLNIGVIEARQPLAVMELAAYAAPAGGTGQWRTTPRGKASGDSARVTATIQAPLATSDFPIEGVGPESPDELVFRHQSPHQTDD